MKLFYSPGACSLSPHIVLNELGVDYAIERVDIHAAAKKTETGEDYLKINPKGQVPALLLDDGTVLTEGPAIVLYLADKYRSRKSLMPEAGSVQYYQAVGWLIFIGTELHKSFGPLFTPSASEESKEQAKQKLMKSFVYVDQQLKGKDYLMGSAFCVADAYLYVVTRWAVHMKFDMNTMSGLNAFMQRMAGRPAVIAAQEAEEKK